MTQTTGFTRQKLEVEGLEDSNLFLEHLTARMAATLILTAVEDKEETIVPSRQEEISPNKRLPVLTGNQSRAPQWEPIPSPA